MITRRIGGEAASRSFFGGDKGRTRGTALLVVGLLDCVLVLYLGKLGILMSVLLLVVTLLGTADTHRGSIFERARRRRWWAELDERGMKEFRPVKDRPASLDPSVGSRRERREKQREWNAYRDFPDGADGLHWLVATPGEPGVAWQTPVGEDGFLSVVYAVSGAVRGLEPDHFVDQVAQRFGSLVAHMAPRLALPTRLQLVTRVMPVDSARHEDWVVREFDPTSPLDLVASYDEVVREVGRGGLAQRHFVAVRWDLTPAFKAEAARHGERHEGWRKLMRGQVESMRRQLEEAGLGTARPLTANQVLAVLRSMQVPEWSLDEVGTLPQTGAWFPSTLHWPYVQVHGVNPDGEPVEWLHRTAVVRARDIETSMRTPLWMNALLGRLPDRIIRTISVQHEAVLAQIAREGARTDVTSDMAEIMDAQEKGELTPEDARVRLEAARARLNVLQPGSSYQGDAWCMHITISAPNRQLMTTASARIAEAAGNAGITSLTWLDAYHSTAEGYTWPLVRGMDAVDVGFGARIKDRLAGTGSKEDLA